MPDSVPMIRMSDVQQTAVHWLWYPYIPFGKLTIEEKIFSMYGQRHDAVWRQVNRQNRTVFIKRSLIYHEEGVDVSCFICYAY